MSKLALSERRLVESWLDDFESSWHPQRLQEFLPHLPTQHASLRGLALVEMVRIDQERQWQQGKLLRLEHYLELLPELGTPGSVSPSLVHAEYEAMRELGLPVTLDELARRFPRQAQEVAQLIGTLAIGARGPEGAQSIETQQAQGTTLGEGDRAADEQADLPKSIGHYRIIKRLGEGGMGTVYLAHDDKLDRQVAIKVPRQTGSPNAEWRQRLRREARAAAKLQHANLCTVFEVEEADGQLYLAMEYIKGSPLSRYLRGASGGKLIADKQAASLVRKVALALDEAHRKGVIHRDLKPANIMINERREPVVMDFGLALNSSPHEARLTQSGTVLGTPAYMPPEQVLGDVKRIGPASDIYSLGVILYEMLAGKLPFDGSVTAVLGQILAAEPEPLVQLRGDVHPALAAICHKAMAKKIEERYGSMADMAAALKEFLSIRAMPAPSADPPIAQPRPPEPTKHQDDGKAASFISGTSIPDEPLPIFAVRPSSARAAKRLVSRQFWGLPSSTGWSGNRRRLVGLAGAFAAPLLLFVGAAIFVDTPKGTIKIELSDPTAGVTVKVDGEEVEITALGEPLRLKVGERRLEVTGKNFKTIAESFTVREGDNDVYTVELVPKGGAGGAIAESQEFKRLAAAVKQAAGKGADARKTIAVSQRLLEYHAAKTSSPEATQAASLFAQLAWPVDKLNRQSIDAEDLRLAADGQTGLVHPSIVCIVGDCGMKHWNTIVHLAFSPTHDILATAGDDGAVKVWNTDTGKLLVALAGTTPVSDAWVAFSANGRILAAAVAKKIHLWDVDPAVDGFSFKPRRTIQCDEHVGALSIAFSPVEESLAAGGMDGVVRVWKYATDEEPKLLKGHENWVWDVTFSSNGTKLASASHDTTVRVWDIKGAVAEWTWQTGLSRCCVAFSPADDQIVACGGDHWSSGSGNVRVWSRKENKELFELGGFRNGVRWIAFSHDGHILAAGANGEFKAWDLAMQEPRLLQAVDHYSARVPVAFDRTGQILAAAGCAVELYDLPGWRSRQNASRHHDRVASVAVSPDGRTLVSASTDKTVKLWDLANGRLRESLVIEHTGGVRTFAFTPDGRWLASAGDDSTIVVREVMGGKTSHSFKGNPDGAVLSLAFSPNGETLASGGTDGVIRLHALGKQGGLFFEHGSPVTALAFSPDGQSLASAGEDRNVRIWNLAEGPGGAVLLGQHTTSARCLIFSPDGQNLAAGDDGGSILLWDVKSRRNLPLEKQAQPVNSLAYSLDGTRLASAGSDGAVRVWDAASGKLRQTIQLAFEQGRIAQVVFTPEGRHVVTANGNGTAYVLRLAEPKEKPALPDSVER